MLPRWNGTVVRQRKRDHPPGVRAPREPYGAIPAGSPGHNQADPALSATDDILGNPRTHAGRGRLRGRPRRRRSRSRTSTVDGGPRGHDAASFAVSLSAATGADGHRRLRDGRRHRHGRRRLHGRVGRRSRSRPAASRARSACPSLGDALDENDETFLVDAERARRARRSATAQATGHHRRRRSAARAGGRRTARVTEGDAGSDALPVRGRADAGERPYGHASAYATAGRARPPPAATTPPRPALSRSRPGDDAACRGRCRVVGDTAVEPDETFVAAAQRARQRALADDAGRRHDPGRRRGRRCRRSS